MLARKNIPDKFLEWNNKYSAPFGRELPAWFRLNRFYPKYCLKYKGPFSLQPNNDTRIYEYPWAFFEGNLKPGMKVLEIGGGLSGFQFVLAKLGVSVTNVDPGMDARGRGWPVDEATICRLNATFGTSVNLINTFMEDANLKNNYFDIAYSISVIEHIPQTEILDVTSKIFNVLKPGGIFIATIDLFLELYPFTDVHSNKFGINIDVIDIVNSNEWIVSNGIKNELYGYHEFNVNEILKQLPSYYIGRNHPTLIQCIVLQKPL